MQLNDQMPVIYYHQGLYKVAIMRRTPAGFLQAEMVPGWEQVAQQAEAAVVAAGGLQHGRLFYPCPAEILAQLLSHEG